VTTFFVSAFETGSAAQQLIDTIGSAIGKPPNDSIHEANSI